MQIKKSAVKHYIVDWNSWLYWYLTTRVTVGFPCGGESYGEFHGFYGILRSIIIKKKENK